MNKTISSFVRHFEEADKPACYKGLGAEIEHFIVHKDTLESIPYSGKCGIRELLGELIALYPGAEALKDDDFFGFTTKDFSITLEPAAQLEISIKPISSVSEIGRIYQNFREKLEPLLSLRDYSIMNLGCQPVSKVDSLELIPKNRYRLMDEHFKITGTGGRQMMRGTASLQVSIDYSSEEDFRRKIQAAYYYSPILKLLCDNARCFQGKPVKGYLKRTDIWRRVDPNRCGILPGIFSPDYGFSDYAGFLWNLVPILIKENGETIPTGFKRVSDIYPDNMLTEDEILHILSMPFPDVRLKQFLEIRVADSVPLPFILAYLSLIKGLFYFENSLDHAKEQILKFSLSEDKLRKTESSLMEKGWDGEFHDGASVREAAKDIINIARNNLKGPDVTKDGRWNCQILSSSKNFDSESIPTKENKADSDYLEAFDNVIEYGGIQQIPECEAFRQMC